MLREELEESSSGLHVFGAWIAVIFDPLFAITDYINIKENWLQLLAIRCSISALILVTIFVYKRKKFPSYFLVILPFVLISLQNAYTFSLIGNDHLLGHSLNYMALLLGGAMFFLWTWPYSTSIVAISTIATAWFVSTNPRIDLEMFFVKGGLLLGVMGLFMIILIKVRYDLTIKEIRARIALKLSNEELEVQKSIVEQKNEKITDSINYAKRIQESVLGSGNHIQSWFSGSLILFQPRDILSGDFYWFYENAEEKIKIVIAADCTGHGVPAALMTIMGNSILNEIVVQKGIYEPDRILKELDTRVIESFNKTDVGHPIDDGMDISILTFHENKALFSAAKNPLYMIREGEVQLTKGSRFPIGSHQHGSSKSFELHEIIAKRGDKFYLISDGFQDQFGGENDRKYNTTRFRELLLRTSTLPMQDQGLQLGKELNSWKGQNRQTDDILVLGVEI